MVMSEKEKINTAYHEAGHAIIGRLVPQHDPVHKVTIIPRGRALGVTQYLPEEDRYSMNRIQLFSQLCSLFGGRIAEELLVGLIMLPLVHQMTLKERRKWLEIWLQNGD